ncbi:hypothetical protein BsWGS_12650 [Bradybaena similaris]
MEPTKGVIKEVLRAAHQFHNNSAQLAYLLRQLETLQTISARSAYIRQLPSSDQVELVECLTYLVDVVREKQTHVELVQRAVSILLNLSHDDSVRRTLHESLNLCPTLVSLVVAWSGLTEDQQSLSEGLQLLQRITYGHRIDYHQANVEDLLKFLIPHVLMKTEALLLPVLGTLANLCRNNLLVQSAIRNMWHGDLKKLLKTLCGFLDNHNQLLVIFSLSVFTNLCLHETEGQKTIFGIIKNSFRTVAWKYAADLLTDLLKHPHMQICIKKYRHLPRCVNDILSLLATNSEESIADMFELLLNLCVIPSVRQSMNCRLFTPLAQNSISLNLMLEATCQSLTSDTEPLLSCLHWVSQELTFRSCTPCLALDFLIDSCQDCMCRSDKPYPVHLLTPVVSCLLSRPEQTSSVEKTIRLIRLLSVLSSDRHSRESLGVHLKTDVFASLVEQHLAQSIVSYTAAGSLLDEEDTREERLQCVLLLLDLAVKVRSCVPGLAEYLGRTLKETRVLDLVALGLTSASQEQVEMSLHLLCFSLGLDNARPDVILCGSIACLNKQKQSSKKLRLDSDTHTAGRPAAGLDHVLHNKENKPCLQPPVFPMEQRIKTGLDKSGKDDTSVDALIEKMEGVIGNKDTKTVEVIEVFEHHIRSLQIKEEHMNNLLEAKSAALTQADRVIAQLRARQASHSAEMKKLQNVLKESERKIDQLVSQINDMKISTETMKSEFECQLDRKREDVEAVIRERDEITEKCAELEEMLGSSRQDNKTLSSMMASLQDTYEVLKEQYHVSCNQGKQLEEEKKTLLKQLKDKDASLQKQSSTLQVLQGKYKETEEERAELEKEKENLEAYVDKLQHQLSSSENTCRQLQQRVAILESVNEDLEEKLKQKTTKVEDLEAELDKHNQIVSFINNMQLRGASKK